MEDPCLYCGAHVQVHAHLVDSRVATIPKQMRGDERERAGVDELGFSWVLGEGPWVAAAVGVACAACRAAQALTLTRPSQSTHHSFLRHFL